MQTSKKQKTNRQKLYEIIYEADTPAGKWFDIIVLWAIIFSIVLVMLDSVDKIEKEYHDLLNYSEWAVTILFTIEYIARIITAKKPWKYIFSFYGIIDLLSTIPKYLSLLFGGSQVLVAVRALRLIRVFRILKLVRYIGEANELSRALKASKAKILVFIFFVVIVAIILGTVMYLIEGPENGFKNIPHSVYWTIVTLTTVGYGDIAPQTPWGQFIATIVMVLGYGIIAVPTGIVTAEFTTKQKIDTNTQVCSECMAEKHSDTAEFCYKCGTSLHE